MLVFKIFLHKQKHFQSWHKVTNIASTDINLMSLLQYLKAFLPTLCTWRVRNSRLEELYWKGVQKIPQILQENICADVSVAIKMQAGGR